MTKKEIETAEQIKRAVSAIKVLRPAYKGILAFYEKLFLAQEDSKKHIHLQPIKISEDLLSVKRKEGFPLIARKDFTIDIKTSAALLREICRFACEANEVLTQAGIKLMDALNKGKVDAPILLSKTLSEDDIYLDETEKSLEIDKEVLLFMSQGSIRPSLSLCAEQLATYLNKNTLWEKGYCPVCGSPPAISLLRVEGERFLFCSFCDHEWHSQRIYCPFCENKNQKTLHYFFSKEEEEYRVDVCDQCRKYIKTIDTRKIKRPVYPFLEQVATLHLDIIAQNQGLQSGHLLWLQT
ncbi:MAG: formate dehydrogenase accessory protein FdhE [Desulfobacteraceae bacterium]|nr:formate dehydrogenase accessory protein FdhE [Desulfobacteraceae bacterium]MBC2720504.1 formate dehydrogenase accessory protein FdhE [Desulfobacteraceae bacterium]